jgi:dolichol-phosphate mannosyltransferase
LDLTTRGFDLEVEVASQVAAKGRITEVPINYRRRIGRKKLSLRDGLTIVTTIFRLANVYNPVLLYSGIAALAALPGGTIVVWVAYRSLVNHVWHSGYALFGVMLFLLATQAFTVATTSILINRSSQKLYRILQDTLVNERKHSNP